MLFFEDENKNFYSELDIKNTINMLDNAILESEKGIKEFINNFGEFLGLKVIKDPENYLKNSEKNRDLNKAKYEYHKRLLSEEKSRDVYEILKYKKEYENLAEKYYC